MGTEKVKSKNIRKTKVKLPITSDNNQIENIWKIISKNLERER